MTRGQLPQRAGSLGLNGGGTVAAVPPRLGIGEVVRYWKAPRENRRAALATDSSLESYDLFAEP